MSLIIGLPTDIVGKLSRNIQHVVLTMELPVIVYISEHV